MSYLVVDDFCPELEKVRASAFAAGFDTWKPNKGEVGSSVYDGMGFWGDQRFMLRALIGNVGMVVPNTMYFRVTNEGMERAYIHSDRESGNHTCICYMTDHVGTDSGTAFFRHKRTGLVEMPSIAEMKDAGVLDELKADMVSRDPDKWVQTDYVKGAYNRALIFKAPLFHSRFPLGGIGSKLEEGRLVWASHFYKLSNAGELY